MKRMWVVLSAGLLAAGTVQAAVLAGYDFTTDTSATLVTSGLSAGAVVEGAGVAAGNINPDIGDTTGMAASGTAFGSTSLGSYGVLSVTTLRTSSLEGAVAADDYFTFTLTSDSGRAFNVSGFSLSTAVASINNGRCADQFNVLAQVNGGNTWSAADALLSPDGLTTITHGNTDWTDTFIDLSGNAAFQGIQSVEFRIYLWGASGTATASSRTNIDQLCVEGFIPNLSLIGITPR